MRVRFRGPMGALSDRTRKAFQLANQEAHRLNHPAVGSEHLLLGLAKEGLSPAATLLRQAGFNLTWLRRQVEARWSTEIRGEVVPGALPYTADLEGFLADIVDAGELTGILPLSPELLLLALAERREGEAGQILRQRRLRLWWLRRRLRALA